MVSRKDILRTAFIGCVLIGIIFMSIVQMNYKTDNVLGNDSNIEYYEGWYFINNGEKVYIDYDNNKLLETTENFDVSRFVIYNELPKDTDVLSMLFTSYHQTVEIYVDDEPIYTFGNTNELKMGKSVGSGYHLVNLNHEYSGKQIKLVMSSPYESSARKTPEFLIGNAFDLLASYIKNQLPAIIINSLIFLTGLVLVISEIGLNNKLRLKKSLYLGAFAISYSVWSILQTNAVQFFTGNYIFGMYLSYLMIMLIPIAVVMLVREHYRLFADKILNNFAIVYMLNYVLCIFLQFTNIIDMKEMILTTHILMMLSAFYVITIVIKKRKRKITASSRLTKISAVAVISTVFIDIFRYYFINDWDTSKFSRVGILILMLIYSFEYFSSYIDKAGKYSEARVLARLAYKDVMTEMYNRTAYAEDISNVEKSLIENSKKQDCKIIYAIFDLNNLKEINDTHGHTVGDYYIVSMSKNIKKAFEKLGKCYRIGGDEFAVIIKNRTIEEYYSAIEGLKNLIEYDNEHSEYEFSIAYGCAETSAEKFISMQVLVNEADKNMYQNKKLYKMSVTTKPIQV